MLENFVGYLLWVKLLAPDEQVTRHDYDGDRTGGGGEMKRGHSRGDQKRGVGRKARISGPRAPQGLVLVSSLAAFWHGAGLDTFVAAVGRGRQGLEARIVIIAVVTRSM